MPSLTARGDLYTQVYVLHTHTHTDRNAAVARRGKFTERSTCSNCHYSRRQVTARRGVVGKGCPLGKSTRISRGIASSSRRRFRPRKSIVAVRSAGGSRLSGGRRFVPFAGRIYSVPLPPHWPLSLGRRAKIISIERTKITRASRDRSRFTKSRGVSEARAALSALPESAWRVARRRDVPPLLCPLLAVFPFFFSTLSHPHICLLPCRCPRWEHNRLRSDSSSLTRNPSQLRGIQWILPRGSRLN